MIGRTVSHYKILEKIGQGGMAIVYKAEDLKLKRIVAIKFHSNNPSIRSDERKRFLREAQAASSLNHPNICIIHEIDEFEDGTFIVMEYVDGVTLHDWIRKKADSTETLPDSYYHEAVAIALQAASGLGKAHDKDIIHRDVKSENIMVTHDGRVKIMDFGLAKLRDTSKLTKTGSTIGTAAYMSPEQVQGLDIDHRTDIFSLGAVLYEMFTGQLPFQADYESALMYQIVNVDPRPLVDVRKGVIGALNNIVIKCLQKRREDRYQSMREVINDLERYEQGQLSEIVHPVRDTAQQRKLAALMFTDIVGYSSLTQKNEALTLDLLDEHRRLLRSLFPKHQGKEIETIGDAFFVEFASALEATRCAIEIQEALHERNAATAIERHIRLRIGLHIGDVVVMGDKVHGDAVNITARIQSLAEHEGVCISEDVERQIRNKIDRPVQKLGRGELKNIQLPVEIFKVVMPWESVSSPFFVQVLFLARQKQVRRYALASIMLAGLVYGGMGIYRYYRGHWGRQPIKSIAVLPFEYSSDVPEYMSDGLTQALINRLSELPFLKVISGRSVFRYRGNVVDPLNVGRTLGTDAIVKGKLTKVSNDFFISTDLLDTRTSDVTWNDRDKPLDILDAPQEITKQLAGELGIPLSDKLQQRMSRRYTSNRDAYDAYLRGVFHLYKSDKADNSLAIEYFTQALQKDSIFVQALVALAHAQQYRYERSWEKKKQILIDAGANCRKALHIDSLDANATAILGVIEGTLGNSGESTRLSEKALGIDQNNIIALTNLYTVNEPMKAFTFAKKAQEIDPLYWGVYSNLAQSYVQMKNYSDAIASLQRSIELESNNSDLWNNLGFLYETLAQPESATVCYRKALQIDPTNQIVYEPLGWLLLSKGKPVDAESLFVKGTVMWPSDHGLLYDLGATLALKGNSTAARNTFQEGLKLVQQKLKKDPSGDIQSFEGLFHARLGNITLAHESANKALRQDSTSEVAIKVTRIYAVLGEKTKMLESFKRAKGLDPTYNSTFLSSALDFERYRTDPDLLAIARQD